MTELASLIMSGALVILTAVLAWHTRMLAIEAKAARMQQSEPQVVVTIEPSRYTTHMDLVIVNTGQGVARNIIITADPDFKVEAYKGGHFFNNYGFLKFDVLKPKQEIRHYLGSYMYLSKHQTSMISTCEDVFGNNHTFTTNIDVSTFDGLSRLGGDLEVKIANNIEKISQALGRALDFNRIRVDCYSSKDRDNERKERDKWYEEAKGERGQER